MARKKNQGQTDYWGESTAIEVERVAAQEKGAKERRGKWWRIGFFAVLLLAPLAILASVSALLAEDTSEEKTLSMTSAPGRAATTSAIEAWLDSDPSPLPGGHILAWDGATPYDVEFDDNIDPEDIFDVWTHSFTLVTDEIRDDRGVITSPRRFYETSVLVSVSDVRGVQVISEPSLIPVAPDKTGWGNLTGWPNSEITSIPPAVKDAIDKWAVAYTGTDPVALKLATGDPDNDRGYVPLGGVSSVVANVRDGAKLLDGQTPTGLMVVSVTLSLDRSVTDEPKTTSLPTVSLDLLIADAETGSPKIVAWGPAKTGNLLTPYENGVSSDRTSSLEDFIPEVPQSGEAVD